MKARSSQRKNNLNHNYNLMDFDTIKIGLVFDDLRRTILYPSN